MAMPGMRRFLAQQCPRGRDLVPACRQRALLGRRALCCTASAPAEQELRRELALAHRLTAQHGMDQLTWNHISVRLHRGSDGFLVTPGGMTYDEIRDQDLALDDAAENETGPALCRAPCRARRAVFPSGIAFYTHARTLAWAWLCRWDHPAPDRAPARPGPSSFDSWSSFEACAWPPQDDHSRGDL